MSGMPVKRIVPVAPVALISAPYSTPSTLMTNSVIEANVWLTTLTRYFAVVAPSSAVMTTSVQSCRSTLLLPVTSMLAVAL